MQEHFKSALSHVVHGIVVAWVVLVVEKAPDYLKEPIFNFFAGLAFLESYSNLGTLGAYIAIAIVICTVIVGGILGIEKLSSISLIVKFGRERKLKRFEGLWAQSVDIDARPYSVGLIKLDAIKHRWKYSCVRFSRDLVAKVKWETYSTWCDNEIENVWYFAGFSRFYEDGTKNINNVVPML